MEFSDNLKLRDNGLTWVSTILDDPFMGDLS